MRHGSIAGARCRVGRRVGSLALGLGFLFTLVPATTATADGCYGTRLYRHRSGYLFGASRNCYRGGPQYGPYYYGGGGYGRDAREDNARYVQRDFDTRRDRLLHRASQIDVSYLQSSTTTRPQRTQPANGGWVFLREGEPVKALGKFTARIMVAPGDAQAHVGFALAAALLDDDGAAAHSMRTAMRFDPAVLRDFASDDALNEVIRGVLARLESLEDESALDADCRFLTASLRGLLHEYASALQTLEGLGVTEQDRSTEALCAALAEGDAEGRVELVKK